METTPIERKTNEETFLDVISNFFDCRKLTEHLIFLDYWLGKTMANQHHNKHLNAKDLAFLSAKFQTLLISCHTILTEQTKSSPYFEETLKIPKHYIKTEQNLLLSYPNYLRTKEICNPLVAFQHVFKKHTLIFYAISIKAWADENESEEPMKDIFETYLGLKKTIEACWLIHERAISKRSYKIRPDHEFALSCPLLLTGEYLNDPYLMVEEFFSFAGIDEYRKDLTKWFKIALNDEEGYENANDLLFVHNQMLQLIHAGYLIGRHRLLYFPKTNYTSNFATFGHWLLAKMETRSIQMLSPHFKENPLDYCTKNLTIDHVIKIRYGLKEWLEAALSKNSNITDLAYPYIFDQFEELQRIMEALCLLVTRHASTDEFNPTSNIN
ncbi:hypothetical protein [Pedobacter insulae]|uniref:Uncharacterized protein n=1 Tax=Pedobacter insulae TaxID=414048 RepID=A0A1I2VG80_9SPHI|nr:hypothetical protein [Pedobacter insulae]SFG88334.1 hypothetical protein SAMN04489864_10327 [Pedobacter insulae]